MVEAMLKPQRQRTVSCLLDFEVNGGNISEKVTALPYNNDSYLFDRNIVTPWDNSFCKTSIKH